MAYPKTDAAKKRKSHEGQTLKQKADTYTTAPLHHCATGSVLTLNSCSPRHAPRLTQPERGKVMKGKHADVSLRPAQVAKKRRLGRIFLSGHGATYGRTSLVVACVCAANLSLCLSCKPKPMYQ